MRELKGIFYNKEKNEFVVYTFYDNEPTVYEKQIKNFDDKFYEYMFSINQKENSVTFLYRVPHYITLILDIHLKQLGFKNYEFHGDYIIGAKRDTDLADEYSVCMNFNITFFDPAELAEFILRYSSMITHVYQSEADE